MLAWALVAIGVMQPAPAWASDAAPTDSMRQRMQACVACHGRDGVASPLGYFPRIAGKPAGYLYNQLLNFREGRRSNATMAYLLQNLSDAYLREIAQYFAELDLPYADPSASSGEDVLRDRGRDLVERGDRKSSVPACASCHGPDLIGDASYVPALVGLRREYLLAQLGAWRSGLRRSAHPDCMAKVSQRLSTSDLEALATYLPALPVPTPARRRATERTPSSRPLECGSTRP